MRLKARPRRASEAVADSSDDGTDAGGSGGDADSDFLPDAQQDGSEDWVDADMTGGESEPKVGCTCSRSWRGRHPAARIALHAGAGGPTLHPRAPLPCRPRRPQQSASRSPAAARSRPAVVRAKSAARSDQAAPCRGRRGGRAAGAEGGGQPPSAPSTPKQTATWTNCWKVRRGGGPPLSGPHAGALCGA
jgi:hypothetical protein